MTIRPLKLKVQNDFRGNPSGAVYSGAGSTAQDVYISNVPHRHTSEAQWSFGKSVAKTAEATDQLTGTQGAIPSTLPKHDEEKRPPVEVKADARPPETVRPPRPHELVEKRVLPYVKQIGR